MRVQVHALTLAPNKDKRSVTLLHKLQKTTTYTLYGRRVVPEPDRKQGREVSAPPSPPPHPAVLNVMTVIKHVTLQIAGQSLNRQC